MKFTTQEILGIIVFYLFFSFVYHGVLFYLNYANNEVPLLSILDPWTYWYSSGMQYVFFFLGSIIIWLLGIFLLRKFDLKVKITTVLILILAMVYLVRAIRYEIIDQMGLLRLEGAGMIWDLYIPTLFLLFQFGCYFAYTYFLETQERLKQENEWRQTVLKSELAALKAQLNPHFLYNVFNTINASIPLEQEKTRRLIAELSDLFRYQLSASRAENVPLGEELDFIKKYLNLEKARFEDRLSVNIEVEEELLEHPIPPMILQPLIENALKHGLASIIEGGKVTLRIWKEGQKLHFMIADTGIGIVDKSAVFKLGTGLSNTKLRLEKMYQSKLHISDNKPSGIKIHFAIGG